jgi:hypothetical protein
MFISPSRCGWRHQVVFPRTRRGNCAAGLAAGMGFPVRRSDSNAIDRGGVAGTPSSTAWRILQSIQVLVIWKLSEKPVSAHSFDASSNPRSCFSGQAIGPRRPAIACAPVRKCRKVRHHHSRSRRTNFAHCARLVSPEPRESYGGIYAIDRTLQPGRTRRPRL